MSNYLPTVFGENLMDVFDDFDRNFLRGFGMQRPPVNLISIIGAEYTNEFGQKKFTEHKKTSQSEEVR